MPLASDQETGWERREVEGAGVRSRSKMADWRPIRQLWMRTTEERTNWEEECLGFRDGDVGGSKREGPLRLACR